jgi:2-oxoglutarate ferredoxin oxidoreductase subunit beta
MTYIVKPRFHHPELPKNRLGYTHRDYEGKISTLCAGCGHDSITAAIIEACFELSIEPHRVAIRTALIRYTAACHRCSPARTSPIAS